jgi:deoxyribodipyrimidine photolyase
MLAIASARPEEFTREQIRSMNNKELRSKYLNLVKALRNLNNYYSKKSTKMGEERSEKYAELMGKCEQEERQLEQENTYALANIIYSKEIQDKRALVRNLIATNREQEAEKHKDELEKMECRERDEHMLQVHDKIVQSKTELRAKHDAAVSAFSIQWDDQEDRLERDRRRDVDGTRKSIAIVRKALTKKRLSVAEEEEEDEEEEATPLIFEEEEEEEGYDDSVWVPFIDEPCFRYTRKE